MHVWISLVLLAILNKLFLVADTSLLPHADYTLCLDGLASQGSYDLYVHVSKPPKVDSKGHELIQALNQVNYISC